MLRFLIPYLLVGLVVSALAGWAYGGGQLSLLGGYGALTLAIVIAVVGYDRWDSHERGRRHSRR